MQKSLCPKRSNGTKCNSNDSSPDFVRFDIFDVDIWHTHTYVPRHIDRVFNISFVIKKKTIKTKSLVHRYRFVWFYFAFVFTQGEWNINRPSMPKNFFHEAFHRTCTRIGVICCTFNAHQMAPVYGLKFGFPKFFCENNKVIYSLTRISYFDSLSMIPLIRLKRFFILGLPFWTFCIAVCGELPLRRKSFPYFIIAVIVTARPC